MKSSIRRIYADYAAATPLDPEVLAVMQPWLTAEFANASATHSDGQRARVALDNARRAVATTLGAAWYEISFMSSGTESINTAVLGVARAKRYATSAPVHVVTTAIEHHAVLDSCKQLEAEGDSVTIVPVAPNGIVRVEDIVAALQPNTVLVSVMIANNEIGTVQPVSEIARAVKTVQPDVLVHTDACQAGNYFLLNVQTIGADLLSLNGSKIYGPKGSAVLYTRSGVKPQPLMFGGGQEFILSPGTENVAAVVGFAAAFTKAQQMELLTAEAGRLAQLRDLFIEGMKKNIPGVQLNGDTEMRLPNNANIFFPDIDGDIFLFELDRAGISASLGSACTAGSIDPSHVVVALGRTPEDARRSVRFTFGRETLENDIQELVERIAAVFHRLIRIQGE